MHVPKPSCPAGSAASECRTTYLGPTFTLELCSLACLVGTTHHTTTSYNPTANGMVKRVHRSLKASLMALCRGPDWKAQLSWVLLSLCTIPRANCNPSPAEKVYGETLTVPGEFFPTNSNNLDIPLARLRGAAQKFVTCQETYTDRKKQFHSSALDSCRFALIRNDAACLPLTRPYQGPHRVVHREEKAFLVSLSGHKD
ncbi:uncharacterized protein LOC135224813 [Macrobrachium nipponense]|uniref:uncharacterized protein LOC135224813 n=1 Tax=Macrobrachium nipponense TaxID=159736 RepID=UPI0030C8AFAF